MQRYRNGAWQTLANFQSYVTSASNIEGISAMPSGGNEIYVTYTRDSGALYFAIYDIAANSWRNVTLIGTGSSSFHYNGLGVTYSDGENIPMYCTARWGGTYDTYTPYIYQKTPNSYRQITLETIEFSPACAGSAVRNGVVAFFVISPWGDYSATVGAVDKYLTGPPHPGIVGDKVLMPHAGNPTLLAVRNPTQEELDLIYGG